MRKLIPFLAIIILLSACSKKDSTNNTVSSTLSGTWMNSAWGGTANNTIKFSFSSDGGAGIVSQLGSSPWGFSVGDALYSNVTSTGNGTYSGNGKYTYGTNNTSSSYAPVTLMLQNNGSTLFAHYAQDASTGITPPDYYYQKQ